MAVRELAAHGVDDDIRAMRQELPAGGVELVRRDHEVRTDRHGDGRARRPAARRR